MGWIRLSVIVVTPLPAPKALVFLSTANQHLRKETLQSELSDPQRSVSSPAPEALASWRVFFECALALPDILDAELERAVDLPFRWYDVLVHLEEAGPGAPMNEVASRILASKSGLTRVIDKMEKAGLVRRERPEGDRRVVLVLITEKGLETLHAARAVHRDGIRRHFTEHLTATELKALARTLEKVRGHVRPLRPGRVSG
jgi:DNA-binding MarR family transcriptional regulator